MLDSQSSDVIVTDTKITARMYLERAKAELFRDLASPQEVLRGEPAFTKSFDDSDRIFAGGQVTIGLAILNKGYSLDDDMCGIITDEMCNPDDIPQKASKT